MDEKVIELKLCLDKLGGFRMDDFKERIALQKKIYLMQLSGLDLGYRFNWYIRGPYSPSLADVAFDAWNNKDLLDEICLEYELNQEASEHIDKIKDLIESKCPLEDDLEHYKWLELLASVHYLKHVAYLTDVNKENKNDLCQKIKSLKPFFTLEQIEVAWDTLNKWGLIKNKTLKT